MLLLTLLQVLTGSRAVSAAAAAAAPAAPNCTYVANLDKNGGDVAPSVRLGPPDSTRQARCCALCAAETKCHAGVLTGPTHTPPHACWLKGGGGSPKANPDVMSCWKPGHKPEPVPPPPPPGWKCGGAAGSWRCALGPAGGHPTNASCSGGCRAPPPPPPQCYMATVASFDEKPVLSSVDGTSEYPQVYQVHCPSLSFHHLPRLFHCLSLNFHCPIYRHLTTSPTASSSSSSSSSSSPLWAGLQPVVGRGQPRDRRQGRADRTHPELQLGGRRRLRTLRRQVPSCALA